ncbi:sodium-dependent transporter [Haloglycomyces albus]|uniref:sodium-dependent transporter n=1 Tax=Haloglycomyces albus TaxID=526067 RepID=UPI0004AD32F0|nr:sodium-dependent transporter [Haloglycomyces albus]
MTRENWGTRLGFILAAVGSAVGLGNIWRFPAVSYENGGGAFLLPYLIALLTAGIPLLIMEFSIGRKYRASAPLAWRKLNKNTEFIGWWQVAIASVIAVYYAAIIGWAAWYTWYSFDQTWGSEPDAFLFTDFLGGGEGPVTEVGLFDHFGDFVPGIALAMGVIWLIVGIVIVAGVRKGIELSNRIFMPLLIAMFGVLVVQALTLDGATDGLDAFFTPDWEALSGSGVWVAAYGQIFFSLSIGFGIMITYASYLRKKADLTTSALTVGFANSSFELLAGIGVFSVLGFMAAQSGTGIDQQVTDGVGLAFVAFPNIINTLPVAAGLFGVLFFLSLTVAGLSSLISIVQVPVAAFKDRFNLNHKATAIIVWLVLAVVSVGFFPTVNGLLLLDVADGYINSFGIAGAGFISIVSVVWFTRKWRDLIDEANRTSVFQVVKRRKDLWFGALGVLTPLILGITLYSDARERFDPNVVDSSVLNYGIAVAGGALAFGIIMNLVLRAYKTPGEDDRDPEDEPTTDPSDDSSSTEVEESQDDDSAERKEAQQ